MKILINDIDMTAAVREEERRRNRAAKKGWRTRRRRKLARDLRRAALIVLIFTTVLSYARTGAEYKDMSYTLSYTNAATSSLSVKDTDAVKDTEITYQLVKKYADKHRIPAWTMWNLVLCETANTLDPSIQSRHVLENGVREKSFGLAQIYLPANPDVSYEEAVDPHFSLDFMGREIARGNEAWRWSNCYKHIMNK